MEPLNRKIREACLRHGWESVSPNWHPSSGYCHQSTEYYDAFKTGFHQSNKINSAGFYELELNNSSFVRTIEESESFQNINKDDKFGAGHPNSRGHLRYANTLLNYFYSHLLYIPRRSFEGNFNNNNFVEYLTLKNDGFYIKPGTNTVTSVEKKWFSIPLVTLQANIKSWCIGDINNDKFDDVIAYVPNKGLVSFINTRSGSFEKLDFIPINISSPAYMNCADFNGDGYDDLFYIADNQFKVHMNNGNMSFSLAPQVFLQNSQDIISSNYSFFSQP